MDAEILNLLLEFPLSPEREGAKFSAACLARLPGTCRLLHSCALVAEIKDGGVFMVQESTPSFSDICLFVVESR